MRTLIFLLSAAVGWGQAVSGKVTLSGKLTVGGVVTLSVVASQSNTQAILTYTAPDTNPCTVKVSESASLTPLVHDVDTALYTNADQDDRDGNLGAGTTSRLIVVGRRTASDLALDSKYYSRALQAYTLHYVRVTCTGAVGNTTFTTNNIPPGMTYTDYPYPTAPAGYYWGVPTFEGNNRSITQVDQFTGMLYKPLTIWDDRVQGGAPVQGFNMSQGGFIQQCTAGLQTSATASAPAPPTPRFVCQLYEDANAFTIFYAIVPSTGEVTKLGFASPRSGAPLYIMGTDMCYEGDATSVANKKYCYAGDWTEQQEFVHDGGTAYNTVSSNDQMAAFDATFDSALFGCAAFWAPKFSYHVFTCTRSPGQDSYGWLVFYYGGDGRVYGSGSCGTVTAGGNCPGILGAVNTMVQPGFRFQAVHNSQALINYPTNPTTPMAFINWQNLENKDSSVGKARWSTTLAANLTGGQTTVTVTGCPTSEYSGGDTFNPGCWQTGGGDIINIGPGNPFIITTAASGSGPYTLTIASYGGSNVSSGAPVWMMGNATILDTTYGYRGLWYLTYWDVVADPHGTSLTKDLCFDPGGHGAYGLHGRVGEGSFNVIYGDISTQISTCPVPLIITDSPTFHGLSGYCNGTACNKHPTYGQTDSSITAAQQKHISDGLTWNGGSSFTNGVATLVTGTLYKYTGATSGFAASNYAADKTVLFRKIFPTVAITGYYPYVDISGPGSVIVGTSGDNGKYCVAYLANECVSGSAAGDIYLNLPIALGSMASLDCLGSDGPRPDRNDLCVGTFPTMGRSAVPQIYVDASSSADAVSKSRLAMGGGVRGVRGMVTFSFAKILPDASWYLMQTGNMCTTNVEAQFCNIWLAKNLPIPSTDAYDRSDFIPINTGTITGGGSVTNAIVKFWYLENGTMANAYCTSRAENCYANAATIPSGANPYSYPSDGSSNTLATLTGVSCSSTCTIDIPALSGRVLYYQIIKRDASNGILSTGSTQMTIVP